MCDVSAGLLERPNISFSSSVGVYLAPQTSQMFRGLNFTIICSVRPQYPEGTFHLTVPWSNISCVHPAVNHSASFFFPAANDTHQGNYSLVYYNEISFSKYERMYESYGAYYIPPTYDFSSKSETLSLIVTALVSVSSSGNTVHAWWSLF